MLAPRGFADLVGRRVGVWGFGVEGHSTLRVLEELSITPIIVDEAPARPAGVLALDDGGLAALQSCEVVIKSPGVSRYREPVRELLDAGVVVTSALALWMHTHDRNRVIGVTGTKGKSTTTSLVAFALRAVGHDAVVAGNIGVPPYDPDFDDHGQWIVLELSSFQAVDLDTPPGIIAITSLGSDHLDWHGDLERYHRDKLSVTWREGDHVTLVSSDPSLTGVSVGGVVTHLGELDETTAALAEELRLLGRHNEHNLQLALAVVARATGTDLSDVMALVSDHARDFDPLPGRLSVVYRDEHLVYVDDGLATSVSATSAALAVFEGPLALICGGFDRGVDYGPLIATLAARRARTIVVTLGPAGERIGELAGATQLQVHRASQMAMAVELARHHLGDGTILLSPAAPSFDAYVNWQERSNDFTRHARQRH